MQQCGKGASVVVVWRLRGCADVRKQAAGHLLAGECSALQ